jgi:hypothetical protein
MFEKADRLGLNKLIDHIAENGPNSVEAFISVADISQSCLVEQNLLDNKYGNSLGEFRSRLHDAQAEGNNLRGEKEMNDCVVIVLLYKDEHQLLGPKRGSYLDKSPDDTEGSKPEVLKRTGLGGRVQKRV